MYAIIFSAFFYWLNLTVRVNIGIKTDNRSFITLVSFIASLVGVFCGPSVYDFLPEQKTFILFTDEYNV